jgi:hypothetical protein
MRREQSTKVPALWRRTAAHRLVAVGVRPRRSIASLLVACTALAAGVIVAPTLSSRASASNLPRYQYGIDTYFRYTCQPIADIEQWATTEVDQYRALGANSIGINFPIYDDSLTSNVVYSKLVCGNVAYSTPPPSLLADVVQIAHAAGLKVLLRPSLDQSRFIAPEWSGLIQPTDMAAWLASYMATIEPYLKMAQTYHVEHFAIESELNSVSPSPLWTTAIKKANKWYKGELEWNYSWFTPVHKRTRPGTSLSVDTYPQLHGTTPATPVAALTKLWVAQLKLDGGGIPNIDATVIDEIGIPAQSGAYRYPFAGLPLAQYPFDQTIQARWFETACRFMKREKMRGIYFWGPWLTGDQGSLPTVPDPSNPIDLQPAGQAAIKACF